MTISLREHRAGKFAEDGGRTEAVGTPVRVLIMPMLTVMSAWLGTAAVAIKEATAAAPQFWRRSNH